LLLSRSMDQSPVTQKIGHSHCWSPPRWRSAHSVPHKLVGFD
jgi:hypothetical protein